jgi:hypothetical protein
MGVCKSGFYKKWPFSTPVIFVCGFLELTKIPEVAIIGP